MNTQSLELQPLHAISALPERFQSCQVELILASKKGEVRVYDNLHTCLSMIGRCLFGYSLRTLDKGQGYLVCDLSKTVLGSIHFKLAQ